MREVGLAGDRAETGEFRTGEARHIGRVAMRIGHALELGLSRRFRDRRRGAELLQSADLARHRCYSAASRGAGPAIDAALAAGIARHLDLGKTGQAVMQAVPQPDRDPLQRRLRQALDLVQHVVVERLVHVGERRLDIVEMRQ